MLVTLLPQRKCLRVTIGVTGHSNGETIGLEFKVGPRSKDAMIPVLTVDSEGRILENDANRN